MKKLLFLVSLLALSLSALAQLDTAGMSDYEKYYYSKTGDFPAAQPAQEETDEAYRVDDRENQELSEPPDTVVQEVTIVNVYEDDENYYTDHFTNFGWGFYLGFGWKFPYYPYYGWYDPFYYGWYYPYGGWYYPYYGGYYSHWSYPYQSGWYHRPYGHGHYGGDGWQAKHTDYFGPRRTVEGQRTADGPLYTRPTSSTSRPTYRTLDGTAKKPVDVRQRSSATREQFGGRQATFSTRPSTSSGRPASVGRGTDRSTVPAQQRTYTTPRQNGFTPQRTSTPGYNRSPQPQRSYSPSHSGSQRSYVPQRSSSPSYSHSRSSGAYSSGSRGSGGYSGGHGSGSPRR